MENLAFITPSSSLAEGGSLSIDTRDAINKRIAQIHAITWLMGNAHSESLNTDCGSPSPELADAAWAVSDLLEQVHELVNRREEVRHD